MRIVLASSEAVPYSKTGGLADVSSALPKALAAAGHTVTLVVPYYPRLQTGELQRPAASTGQAVRVLVGGRLVEGNLLWGTLPGTDVTVLFVDQPSVELDVTSGVLATRGKAVDRHAGVAQHVERLARAPHHRDEEPAGAERGLVRADPRRAVPPERPDQDQAVGQEALPGRDRDLRTGLLERVPPHPAHRMASS